MNTLFLQGVLHPLQTPTHLIMLIGLGLWLGQQGMRHLRWGAFAFLLALSAGLVLHSLAWKTDVVLLISATTVGLLLTLRLPVPLWSSLLLATLAGLLIGVASSPNIMPGLKALKIYTVMAGTLSSATTVLLVLALLGLGLRQLLEGIVLRILGSWVAASACMVLTLLFVNR